MYVYIPHNVHVWGAQTLQSGFLGRMVFHYQKKIFPDSGTKNRNKLGLSKCHAQEKLCWAKPWPRLFKYWLICSCTCLSCLSSYLNCCCFSNPPSPPRCLIWLGSNVFYDLILMYNMNRFLMYNMNIVWCLIWLDSNV